MFVDKVLINVFGGGGGKGCVSFFRERFLPKGGPDGGDGGNGGNVFIQGNPHEQSLAPLKFQNQYKAEYGLPGSGQCMHGRNGKDVIISVPAGTIIKDVKQDGRIIGDIDSSSKQVLVAKGGKGGKGNSRFASSTNQMPRRSTPGLDGENFKLELELKIIADIGLVGYPNVGKSTFLTSVSKAKPKIASYPFTTLSPHVGVVQFDDFFRMTLADIPGIVEGAHNNYGLGHDFLKHIERTKILAYVLDMEAKDGKMPWDVLCSLKKELGCYQVELPNQTSIILANKMDKEESVKNLAILKTKTDLVICPISALNGTHVMESIKEFRKLLIHKNL
jgi:GTP-binding protein